MSREITKARINKAAEFVAKSGNNFIETLKQKYKDDPDYDFLYPVSADHQMFLSKVDSYKSLRQASSQQAPEPTKKEQYQVKTMFGHPRKKFQDEDISVGVMASLLKKEPQVISL